MKHLKVFENLEERNGYMNRTPLPDYPYVHYIKSLQSPIYSGPETDVPLYIESIDGGTVKFSNTYQYSIDAETWTSATSSSTINVAKGSRLYVRASGLTASSSNGIGAFTVTGKFNVGGNIMSMAYGDGYRGKKAIVQQYNFRTLFYNCKTLISAKYLSLPATILSNGCYRALFSGCTSLVTAPELPAMTLASECYQNMFANCTSLVAAPELPAMTLASNCYNQMFYYCRKLVAAPELPAMTLEDSCYYKMFIQCTSLVTAPELLPATTLKNSCYYQMFDGCTSLVTAPELPAMTLADSCYYQMFDGCTSLVTAPELPAMTLADSCYYQMFDGCTSLVTAPELLPATTLQKSCYLSMFQGCTSLVAAPELPAMTLVSYCYQDMFKGCTNLSYIKAMFTTYPTSSFTYSWVSGVAETGTFVKNSAAAWNVTGVDGVPSGWTVVLEAPLI